MPILGIVVNLCDAESGQRRKVLKWIEDADGVECGEAIENRVPVVLDAESKQQADDEIAALDRMPGVSHVEVVYAQFEDFFSEDCFTDLSVNDAEAKEQSWI